MVVENPSVPAILTSTPQLRYPVRSVPIENTHVGKKFTKPSPSSCEQVMIMKIGTFGSFRAMMRPFNALHQTACACQPYR